MGLLKRALFWTGWASIVNTSFSCLTPFPSNRKTEMRPCKKKEKGKKKKVLKGSRQYLIHPYCSPCTARRPAKVKITSDVSASSLDITKPVQADGPLLYRGHQSTTWPRCPDSRQAKQRRRKVAVIFNVFAGQRYSDML